MFRGAFDAPVYDEPLTQTQLLDIEITANQANLIFKCNKLTGIGHQRAEQIGQILDDRFGAAWVGPDQRQHRIDGIEQKVRANARLQRLQTRRHHPRRERPATHAKVLKHEEHAERGQRQRSGKSKPCGARIEGRYETVDERGDQHHKQGDQHHRKLIAERPEFGMTDVERDKTCEQDRLDNRGFGKDEGHELRVALTGHRDGEEHRHIDQQDNPADHSRIAKIREHIA